jgi:uncharacterized protein (TIGR02646 family)
MRRIVKGREPASLARYRSSTPQASWRWDDYRDKQEARIALCREQCSLCCFCQQRIRPDERAMKIAHFVPRTDLAEGHSLQLQWSNLFGACVGGEGRPPADQHCDTRQRNQTLHPRLHPASFVPGTLTYNSRGEVSADDADVHRDIEVKLNLNLEKLKRNRRAALDELMDRHARGHWSAADLERWIKAFSTELELPEFCDFLLWWLRRQLHRRSTRDPNR